MPAAFLALPEVISTVEELEEVLSRPGPGVVDTVRQLDGDFLILGVGGKMGPTLAWQLKRALEAAGKTARVYGVARFSTPGLQQKLASWGVETIACDLLERGALDALPAAKNVFYLAARKFGSTGNEPYTWAMNTYLPGMVAERFAASRIVALSTGNVYPLSPVTWGGSKETDALVPLGEYAQSCLGRERLFQYFSSRYGTPVTLIRLNYAVELRYGILLDIAQKVYRQQPIPLAMGNVNVIWQGDANAYIIRTLTTCASPPAVFNLTGPETLSVRWLAQQFGAAFGIEPICEGEEASTALLSDAARLFARFGYPMVPYQRLIPWIVHWVTSNAPTLGKPTHYEEREGKF